MTKVISLVSVACSHNRVVIGLSTYQASQSMLNHSNSMDGSWMTENIFFSRSRAPSLSVSDLRHHALQQPQHPITRAERAATSRERASLSCVLSHVFPIHPRYITEKNGYLTASQASRKCSGCRVCARNRIEML